MSKRLLFARMLVSLSLVFFLASVRAADRGVAASHGIVNFGKVAEGLFRGAQPDATGIRNLKELGVRSIINLRTPGDVWGPEEEQARANGIIYTNVPFKGLGRPTDDQVTRVLQLIDTLPGPVFIHCEFGCDRTGTIVACYRMRYDGWSDEAAQSEANEFGMSKLERGMRSYVAEYPKLLRKGAVTRRPVEAKNADLDRFLPADGNTVYPATRLLRSWPEGGPKLLWQTEVGGGRSAVVEANGRAYTAGQVNGSQWAYCLDPKTGKVLWKHQLSLTGNSHHINGPVASPVVDGERVYFVPYEILNNDIYYPHCPVICLKTDGTELWRESEKYWATEGSTPLVVGDTLYICSTGTNHLMAAVDKLTGKLRWGTQLPVDPNDPSKKIIYGAPASVTYQEVAGIPQVICGVYGTAEVIGVDARNGEIMWHFPYPDPPIKSGLISSPVAVGSRLFLSGGESASLAFGACLEMIPKDGKLEAKKVYVDHKLQANRVHTVAVYEGAVFGFGGAGEGTLQCTRLADGKLLWEAGNGDWTREMQLMIADGLMFAITRHDELVLAEASPAGYKELSRFKLPAPLGKYPQQPTLANGRLYIRSENQALCYQITK